MFVTTFLLSLPLLLQVSALSHETTITTSSCMDAAVFGAVYQAYCPVFKQDPTKYKFNSVNFKLLPGETDKASAYCTYTAIATNTTQFFTDEVAQALGGGPAQDFPQLS